MSNQNLEPGINRLSNMVRGIWSVFLLSVIWWKSWTVSTYCSFVVCVCDVEMRVPVQISICFSTMSRYLNERHYTIKPLSSPKVFSDVSLALRSALPIFSKPFEAALCVSMCLGKTAFCTNWSQWHKLQGWVNKSCLHGNACWRVCPLRSLQHNMGSAVWTPLKEKGWIRSSITSCLESS